jgi:hypothetical protein
MASAMSDLFTVSFVAASLVLRISVRGRQGKNAPGLCDNPTGPKCLRQRTFKIPPLGFATYACLIRLRNRLCAAGALVLRAPSADARNQVRAWVLCDAPVASRDVRSCGRLPEPWIVKPLAKLHRSDGAGVVVGRINEDDGIFRRDRRRHL